MGLVIDNTNLINLCRDCGLPGFLPVATYAFDAAAKTVTIDASGTVVPATVAKKKTKIRIHDFFGGTVVAEISAADVDQISAAIDVSSLNLSKQLAISVTIILDNGGIADGGAYGIGAAGDIGHWDIQLDAANA